MAFAEDERCELSYFSVHFSLLLLELQTRLRRSQRASANPDFVGRRLDCPLDLNVIEVQLVEAQRKLDVLLLAGSKRDARKALQLATGCSTLAAVLRM